LYSSASSARHEYGLPLPHQISNAMVAPRILCVGRDCNGAAQ
jgi:hypothetical protein